MPAVLAAAPHMALLRAASSCCFQIHSPWCAELLTCVCWKHVSEEFPLTFPPHTLSEVVALKCIEKVLLSLFLKDFSRRQPQFSSLQWHSLTVKHSLGLCHMIVNIALASPSCICFNRSCSCPLSYPTHVSADAQSPSQCSTRPHQLPSQSFTTTHYSSSFSSQGFPSIFVLQQVPFTLLSLILLC